MELKPFHQKFSKGIQDDVAKFEEKYTDLIRQEIDRNNFLTAFKSSHPVELPPEVMKQKELIKKDLSEYFASLIRDENGTYHGFDQDEVYAKVFEYACSKGYNPFIFLDIKMTEDPENKAAVRCSVTMDLDYPPEIKDWKTYIVEFKDSKSPRKEENNDG